MRDFQIGSIRVRVEDLAPVEGRRLGERVAALLADRLADGEAARRDVGLLRARVAMRGGETVEQLAEKIVGAIIGGM